MQGDGESGEAEGNFKRSTCYHKRTKNRSRVWEKVAWFTRRSKGREDDDVTVPCDASGLPNDIQMDHDTSPASSMYDSQSLLNVSLYQETSSSSDGETDSLDVNQVKRSRLYPNSEVIEQNCLKPSVAKALFLQMDSTNKNSWSSRHIPKHSWPKKKGGGIFHWRDSYHVSNESHYEDETMPRTISMPSNMVEQSSCHCAACCTCTPAHRLMGLCPAHVRLSTSTTSLDTGLSLSYSCNDHIPAADNQHAASAKLIAPQEDDISLSKFPTDSPQHKLDPQFSVDLGQFKSNSLPMYYSKKCKLCGKPTYKSHLPYSDRTFQDLAAVLNVCLCKSSTISGCQKGQTPKTETNEIKATEDVIVKPPKDNLRPREFRQRKSMIREWFADMDNEQKNLVLKDILGGCDLPQMHLLSMEMEGRLHLGCPPNCQDFLTWLPHHVTMKILGYLDPVSLSRASGACKPWYQLANAVQLWRNFCCLSKWRLSISGEQKQLLQHIKPNGSVDWKKVFAERYRLRNNWLRGKCYVRTFEGHTQGISCVQFDDTRIVSGSSDKTIKVWNIRTNSPWSVQTLVGHSGTVRCLHLQGNRLVSGSTDKTIKVWDLSTQQSWSSIACKVTMTGHLDTVRCLQVDDEKVISGSYDKTLKVWNIRTGQCHNTLRGHDAAVLCVQFDQTKIVSGSCDKTIKVWDFNGTCLMTLQGHHDAVTCLQFDNTRIISGSLDCNLKFWDLRSGKCMNTIDWKASEGHTGVVRCLQADSWRVVSASDDRTLKVWSLETGQRLVTLRNHTDGVTCLQFNDSIIVSGSYDKTVKLWDFSCC